MYIENFSFEKNRIFSQRAKVLMGQRWRTSLLGFIGALVLIVAESCVISMIRVSYLGYLFKQSIFILLIINDREISCFLQYVPPMAVFFSTSHYRTKSIYKTIFILQNICIVITRLLKNAFLCATH